MGKAVTNTLNMHIYLPETMAPHAYDYMYLFGRGGLVEYYAKCQGANPTGHDMALLNAVEILKGFRGYGYLIESPRLP